MFVFIVSWARILQHAGAFCTNPLWPLGPTNPPSGILAMSLQ